MKKLLMFLCLLPALAFGDEFFGIAIFTNGWTKANNDVLAQFVQSVLGDNPSIDFLQQGIVRDPPAQKYYYMIWARGDTMRKFRNQSVYAAKADIDQWLSTNGAINSFVTILATNAATWEAAELACGYLRVQP